jgi:hypothetical protein
MSAHNGRHHEMTQLAPIARLRHCHLKNNQQFGGTMLSYFFGIDQCMGFLSYMHKSSFSQNEYIGAWYMSAGNLGTSMQVVKQNWLLLAECTSVWTLNNQTRYRWSGRIRRSNMMEACVHWRKHYSVELSIKNIKLQVNIDQRYAYNLSLVLS